MKGLVIFAFALRGEASEPNPCNVRLGKAAERIIASEEDTLTIVSQWEVSRQLRADGFNPSRSVELQTDGIYLDSEIVWAEARLLFDELGITEVIPVAQPFLQMLKAQHLIAADGFTVTRRRIGWVGFDRRSTQWWTRGPIRLTIYAIGQVLLGIRGHNGKQAAA
ncbi:hypothetical protein HJC99_04160 [Candidatus Saccharibacteria bacterium]|nr:hypothetical protein [Candidatus Saccharibacteria bacterium]